MPKKGSASTIISRPTAPDAPWPASSPAGRPWNGRSPQLRAMVGGEPAGELVDDAGRSPACGFAPGVAATEAVDLHENQPVVGRRSSWRGRPTLPRGRRDRGSGPRWASPGRPTDGNAGQALLGRTLAAATGRSRTSPAWRRRRPARMNAKYEWHDSLLLKFERSDGFGAVPRGRDEHVLDRRGRTARRCERRAAATDRICRSRSR